VILTHSPTLAAKQSAEFDQTLAKATRALGELDAEEEGGYVRMVETEPGPSTGDAQEWLSPTRRLRAPSRRTLPS
jgi:hypothetical protein